MDVSYDILDCALGGSPFTSYSGVVKNMLHLERSSRGTSPRGQSAKENNHPDAKHAKECRKQEHASLRDIMCLYSARAHPRIRIVCGSQCDICTVCKAIQPACMHTRSLEKWAHPCQGGSDTAQQSLICTHAPACFMVPLQFMATMLRYSNMQLVPMLNVPGMDSELNLSVSSSQK